MPSTSSATTTAKSESIISQRRSLSRSRRNTVTVAECLSSHILHGRQRFVSLLTLQDPAGLGRLSMEELESTLLKMWPSISQESLELVIKSLPLCEDGMIDYRPLLKGGLTECVEKYFERSESSLMVTADSATITDNEVLPSSEGPDTTTTMGGDRGALSTAHKDEEKRQFEVLLGFCRERGIVLDTQLLEKGVEP